MIKITGILAAMFITACGAQHDYSNTSDANSAGLSPTTPVVNGPVNGSCATAKGDLVYTATRYQGGVNPGAGMVVATQKLTMNGKVVGETQIFAGNFDEKVVTPWLFSLRFIPETVKVLSTTGNSRVGTKTYSQDVEGINLRGLGPRMSDKKFVASVVCKISWNALLP